MMLNQIQAILQRVLDIDDLTVSDDTTAADVEGWDSLAHVTLMFSIEQEFEVQFSGEEFASLSDIGALRRTIEAKLANGSESA